MIDKAGSFDVRAHLRSLPLSAHVLSHDEAWSGRSFALLKPIWGSGWDHWPDPLRQEISLPAKPLFPSHATPYLGRVWAIFSMNLIFPFPECSCLSFYLTKLSCAEVGVVPKEG